MLTRAYTGRLARGVANRWVDEVTPRLAELAPFPIHSWFFGKLRVAALAADRVDLVSLYAGQAAPLVTHARAASLCAALVV